MKIFYLLALFVLLPSCATTIEKYNFSKVPEEKVLSIGKLNVNFTDNSVRGWKGRCSPIFKNKDNADVKIMDSATNYFLLESNSEPVSLFAISCTQWDSDRIRKVELDFHPKEGGINYFGDITINWKPERFKPEDLLSGIKLLITTEDKGEFEVKVSNNSKEAKAYIDGITGQDNKVIPNLLK
jgi:hypothetical protein